MCVTYHWLVMYQEWSGSDAAEVSGGRIPRVQSAHVMIWNCYQADDGLRSRRTRSCLAVTARLTCTLTTEDAVWRRVNVRVTTSRVVRTCRREELSDETVPSGMNNFRQQ